MYSRPQKRRRVWNSESLESRMFLDGTVFYDEVASYAAESGTAFQRIEPQNEIDVEVVIHDSGPSAAGEGTFRSGTVRRNPEYFADTSQSADAPRSSDAYPVIEPYMLRRDLGAARFRPVDDPSTAIESNAPWPPVGPGADIDAPIVDSTDAQPGSGVVAAANLTGGLSGDINGDGVVNRVDIALLATNFGRRTGADVSQGDLDGDGAVTLADVIVLRSSFADTTPPAFSVIPTPSNISSRSALISWTTTEPTDARIEYGVTHGSPDKTREDHVLLTNHAILLDDLAPGQTNHLIVTSNDAAGNAVTYHLHVDTLPSNDPPVIAGVSIVRIDVRIALIQWTTDVPSDTQVKLGPGTAITRVEPLNSTPTTIHSVYVANLAGATLYRVDLYSRAANGKLTVQTTSFTTPSTADSYALAIRNASAVNVTSSSSTMIWNTDVPADSQFRYYKVLNGINVMGPYDSQLTTSHALTIDNLEPDTTYHAILSSRDAAGTLGVFHFNANFKTLPASSGGADTTPPVIAAGPQTVSLTSTQVSLSFSTDEDTTVVANLGDGGSSPLQTIHDAILSKTHTVSFANLLPGTEYHVDITVSDAAGNSVSAHEHVDTPPLPGNPSPSIFDVVPIVANVTESSALVQWTTDVDADALVEYGDTHGSPDRVKADPIFRKQHAILLDDLAPGHAYHVQVTSQDAAGNVAVAHLHFDTLNGNGAAGSHSHLVAGEFGFPAGKNQSGAEGVLFTALVVPPLNLDGTSGTLTAAGLPAGATFQVGTDGIGRILWTPGFLQGGKTYKIPVTAVASGASQTLELEMAIGDTQGAPVLTLPVPEPILEVGHTAVVALAAADAEGDAVSIGLVNASEYASGSALLTDFGDGTATLSFTPATDGYHYLRIAIRDSQGNERIIPVAFRVGRAIGAVQSGDWSDPATWGGTVPSRDNRVVVGSHHTVTIDGAADAVEIVIQDGGTLRFSRTQDSSLNLRGSLMVLDGALDVGSQSDPIPDGVTATIAFDVPSEEVILGSASWAPGPMAGMPDFRAGDIGLWVMGPNASATFRGSRIDNPWTKLAQDAKAGDTSVVVVDAVDRWKPGDRLVLSSTQTADEVELLTVASVQGNVIALTSPLAHFHEGSLYAYDKATDATRQLAAESDLLPGEILIPIRAAIGDLSRNVLVYSRNVTESDPNHRAHTVFMMGATASIEYAEFRDLGPRGKLGRYPVHVHKMGEDGAGVKIEGASIWSDTTEPGNKWLAIHRSAGVVVKSNVFYNAQGRGVYLEAGEEEVQNQIIDNLGVLVIGNEEINNAGDAGTGHERDGAIFWIRRKNVFQGNVAANLKQGASAISSAAVWMDGRADANSGDYPTVVQDLEIYGNDTDGFFNENPVPFVIDRMINGRSGYQGVGYRAWSNSAAVVTNSVFFDHSIASAFSYAIANSVRDVYEDNLFLSRLHPAKPGQKLNGAAQYAIQTIYDDSYNVFRRNVFQGFGYAISNVNSYMIVENNHFVDGKPMLMGAGGHRRPGGPTLVAHFAGNTGPGMAGYNANEFWLVSRATAQPQGAIYDRTSRAWMLDAAPPTGGQAFADDVLLANPPLRRGVPNHTAMVAVLRNGVIDYAYDNAYPTEAYANKGRAANPTDSEGTGYPFALVPGEYEVVVAAAGHLPVLRSVAVGAGEEVRLAQIALPASPVKSMTVDDPDALTIVTSSVGETIVPRSNNAVFWVLLDDEVVACIPSVNLTGISRFAISQGNYEILAQTIDRHAQAIRTTTGQALASIALVENPWDLDERQGRLAGTLRDLQGNAVPNATVQIRSHGELERVTMTDVDGNFIVQGLLAGDYDIRIAKNGVVSQSSLGALARNAFAQVGAVLGGVARIV